MRRTFISLISLFALCGASLLYAQDAQLLNQYDYVGTARYTAMAGAMASVGADPSAVLDNPAGLGLYRRLAVTLTMHGQLDYTRMEQYKESQFRGSFMLPQISMVFAFDNTSRNSAMRFCNFMFSYNRLHTFNRKTWGQAANQPTIANQMMDQAENFDETTLSQSRYNNANTGWLSELGYQAYMIDPVYAQDANGDTIFDSWQSYYGIQPANGIYMEESGSIDEFNLHWGALFAGHWSVGVGLNIRSLDYYKQTTYEEALTADNVNYAQIRTRLSQKGVGVSGTFGVIYQPARPVRLGLAFQTPTAMNITTRTEADSYLKDGTLTGQDATPIYRNSESLSQPLRTTAGATFLFGEGGLISLQYDFRHHRTTNNVHTFKIGGEIAITNNWFLNCGYAYETAFIKNEQPTLLPRNSVRTDAEYRTIGLSHFAAAGMGFRNQHVVAQLAYRFRYQQYDLYPFTSELVTPDAYSIQAMTHNIVLTLGWHTAK